ncbi:cellulose synthase complex periplasmic endoglucanase BcsZ [Pusillimonas sp.]|uniref:cellulose synthase complex periplasmic endoglucanase BcsZ n=1 Tax=Pusillimonas sp. TaxID=3040095 RepID=UPI0029B83480|nr:cellulose synthase complex periplasmic endoglucanase BcsZ [Pusillimonas sp.]MDX3895523.1 cellulose synthase complex periplasmic endoglucanase BcsZ [Pusillimonas sp.]
MTALRTILKKLVRFCLGLFLLHAGVASAASACKAPDWPLWNDFRTYFVQDSGRVLDASTEQNHSSSEGQSYGMFFALVADDRETFDRLWNWTIDNLMGGALESELPAWIWGKADDGAWRVIDANSASDADLWFAYALLEAGRLWKEPEYTRQAHALLALVESHELSELPGFGLMLMPGREGFIDPERQSWRLNPSYLPIPMLRRLADASPDGPWQAMADRTAAMMDAVAPRGFAPDWTTYRSEEGKAAFIADTEKGATGSYDAIRTYLWAGMTSPEDPLFAPMLKTLDGMVDATREQGKGVPPEKVDALSGETEGKGPFGFSSALIPYFKAKGQGLLLEQQTLRARAMLRHSTLPKTVAQQQPPYYDFVLSLFGLGWLDNMYRFRVDGTLSLPWENECVATTD